MAFKAMIGCPTALSSPVREIGDVRAMNMSEWAPMASHHQQRPTGDGGGSVEGAGVVVGVVGSGSRGTKVDLPGVPTRSARTFQQWVEHANRTWAADGYRFGWHRHGNVWLTGKGVVGKKCQSKHESRGDGKAHSNDGVAASSGWLLRCI
jgi:hypothetical protein